MQKTSAASFSARIADEKRKEQPRMQSIHFQILVPLHADVWVECGVAEPPTQLPHQEQRAFIHYCPSSMFLPDPLLSECRPHLL